MSDSFASRVLSIYERGGMRAVSARLASFTDTRLRLLLYRLAKHGGFDSTRSVQRILEKQAGDRSSSHMLGFLLPLINRRGDRDIEIVVPNYLEPAFNLVSRIINRGRFRALAAENFGDAPGADALVLNKAMINQMGQPLVDRLPYYQAVFGNEAYFVLLNRAYPINVPSLVNAKAAERTITEAVAEANSAQADEPITTSEGFSFFVRPGTMDAGIIQETREEYITWLRENSFHGKTVIDLGGHIGSFSVQVTALLGAGAQVHIYEPEPKNFLLIQRNVKLNGLAGVVTPFQMAVAGKAGKAVLYVSSDNTGGNKLGMREASSKETVQVEVTTLPEAVARVGSNVIDLLKIDVEGSEHEILLECGAILSQQVRYIVGEAGGSLRGDGLTIVEFLRNRGFHVDHRGSPAQLIFWAANRHLGG